MARRGARRDDRRGRPAARDRPHRREHPAGAHRGGPAAGRRSPRDWTRGAVKTVPPQWLPGPRELRAWTLAAGTPEADRYLLGPGPARPRHPCAACVGADAGGDRTDFDRHQGRASGAADQRPPTAIAPGRERGGTSGRRRGVLALAPDLTARDGGVSLRRLARGAKLSVASGAGSSAERMTSGSRSATGEVERRQQLADGDRGSGRNGRCAATRHRRVADQGAQNRRLPGHQLHRRVLASGTSATCRAAPPTCPPSTRASRGRGSASTSTHDFEPLYIVSPDKKSTVAELKDLLKDVDELYLATDGDREGEAIAWHLLETLKPQRPGQADGVPRDHRAGHPGRRRGPARPGQRPGRRPGDPPHPRPAVRLRGQPRCCGRRSRRSCRPAGCSRWRPGSSCSASASGWRSAAPATGTSPPNWTPACPTPQASPPTFTARLITVDGRRVATGRDFDSLGELTQARRGAGARRGRRRRAGRRGCAARSSTVSARSRRSPTPAGRTRRS